MGKSKNVSTARLETIKAHVRITVVVRSSLCMDSSINRQYRSALLLCAPVVGVNNDAACGSVVYGFFAT